MIHPASNRTLARSLAALSVIAALACLVSIRLGIGRTPMRSVEVLVVPTLALVFLYPAYALAAGLPSSVWSRLEGLRSGRAWRVGWPVIVALGILGVIWAVFGGVLNAQWSVVEDFETVEWLGSDGRASLSELPALFSHTEVGAYGVLMRFRPTYYFLRVLETVVWGMNPTAWYGFRLVLLGIAAILFWRITSPTLGYVGSAFLCLYALTFGYWVDMVGRLGPSETYTVLGLPIYLAGVAYASRDGAVRRWGTFLAPSGILLGSLLCMGSKENFLLLLAPTLYVFVRAVRRRDAVLAGSAAASLLFGFYVAGSLVIALTHSGVDVYDKPISLGMRIGEIVSVTRERHFVTPFTVLVGLTGAIAALRLIPRLTDQQRRAIGSAQLWHAALCVVYFSQLVFYNAYWPATITRYGFPGLLYLPASVLILYRLARAMLGGVAAGPQVQAALRASLILSLALAIAYHEGFSEITRALRGKVAATREFTARIEAIARVLNQDQSRPLVIESGNVMDFEPAYFTYPRFLRAYRVRNQLFLRLTGYTPGTVAPDLSEWARMLEQVSAQGGNYYSPLDDLDEQAARCYSLFLSATYPTSCAPLE